MDKQTLRTLMKGVGKGSKAETERIIASIKKSKVYHDASVILAYMPIAGEVDIRPLFMDKQKTFLFPVIKEGGDMYFASSQAMQKNRYGIWEPVSSSPEPYESALMLVPGLAFTFEGRRLGRGGGYYDRYIKQNKRRLYTIGVTYASHIIPYIDTDEWDQIMDTIITDSPDECVMGKIPGSSS